MNADERLKELEETAIFAATELGLYDGEDAEEAIQCMQSELDGFYGLMWRLLTLCHADSARPDDVFAAVQKAVKGGATHAR